MVLKHSPLWWSYGPEHHLGAGVLSVFVCPSIAMLLRKAHEDSDYIAMVTIVHRHVGAKTRASGKVVSTVLIFCLPSGQHCLLNQTPRSSHDVCVNWNELLASRLLCTDTFE